MFSASLVQLGTTSNYIAVKEQFLGFVLVYELTCTELHGSSSFVKCVDPFCAIINKKDTKICDVNEKFPRYTVQSTTTTS